MHKNIEKKEELVSLLEAVNYREYIYYDENTQLVLVEKKNLCFCFIRNTKDGGVSDFVITFLRPEDLERIPKIKDNKNLLLPEILKRACVDAIIYPEKREYRNEIIKRILKKIKIKEQKGLRTILKDVIMCHVSNKFDDPSILKKMEDNYIFARCMLSTFQEREFQAESDLKNIAMSLSTSMPYHEIDDIKARRFIRAYIEVHAELGIISPQRCKDTKRIVKKNPDAGNIALGLWIEYRSGVNLTPAIFNKLHFF